MKKVITFVVALAVCLSLIGVASAAGEKFVPSITYKGHPDITAVEGIEDVGCLRIVPYAERDTKLSAEEAKFLEEVFTKLESGELTLPTEGAIREFLDIALTCNHDHAAQFAAGEIAITVTFDLGIEADEIVNIYSYHNNGTDYEWVEAMVVNNGDGTVSATFTKLCPVAISLKQ